VARIKYDVSKVESRNQEPPKPGVYPARVVEMKDESPEGKDRRLVVVFELTGPQANKGFRLWEYINLVSEAAAWKLRQFTDAVQLPAKGMLDPDHPEKLKAVQIRVTNENYNGDIRARVGSMLPLAEAEDEPDDEEEEVDEVDEETEEGDDEIDLESLTLPELKKMAKDDYGIDVTTIKGKAKLESRGLKAVGPKSKLVARLEESDQQDPFES
jgi:hypothetical protein